MRSRQKESVLNQAQRLVDNGYVEIVLTGIHTAGYGEDLDDYSFYELLVDLVKIKGLKRLRISSIETSQISDEIIDLIGSNLKKHITLLNKLIIVNYMFFHIHHEKIRQQLK